MARFRWIQIDGKLVPADEVTHRESTSPYIIGDIQPYRSMATGQIIEGRRQHREMLKATGCIEIGNDSSIMNPVRKPLKSPPGLKQELIRVANEKLRQER